MIVQRLKDTFPTAIKNMDFDRSLLAQSEQGILDACVRVYPWLSPSITIPEKRTIPPVFTTIDLSTRPTGGGIVFHSPGDLVLCVILPLKSPIIPTSLKAKLHWISDWIRDGLSLQSIVASPRQHDTGESNLQFCKGYFSPFELYVGSEKICGLTLRRVRTHVIIQGIIHLSHSLDFFSNFTEFKEYFSRGLDLDSHRLQQDLLHHFPV